MPQADVNPGQSHYHIGVLWCHVSIPVLDMGPAVAVVAGLEVVILS